jgi:mono/diheme cytochrome c family protein
MIRLTPPLLAAAFLAMPGLEASADEVRIERGKYFVGVAGCGDCHTPGYFLGKPDMSRQLGGSEVGFEIPLGTFYGPNLTPDKDTGLGNWSEEEIVTAFTTGMRPDGRGLAPVMPWMNYAKLKHDDASAIAAYLKTLPAVSNKVPGPFGPNEKATSFVMRIIPPGN